MRQNDKQRPEDYQIFNVAFSFGASMAVAAYLSYKAGNWLDERFRTGHTLMLALVVMAVVASIRVLLKDLGLNSKKEAPSGDAGTGAPGSLEKYRKKGESKK